MMKRRGFLAFIGLAPVAGPAVLEDAVTGRNMLGLGAKAARHLGNDDPENYPEDDDDVSEKEAPPGPYDPKNYFRERIRDAVESYRKQQIRPLIEYIRAVDQLDGDLQTARALSLTAKIRIQAERNRDLNLKKQHLKMSQSITSFRNRLFEKDEVKETGSLRHRRGTTEHGRRLRGIL